MASRASYAIAISIHRSAIVDDRSFASPSTDRASK